MTHEATDTAPAGPSAERAIAALAVVKVMFDRDESFLGYFEPFLEHCMQAAERDEVSVLDLQGKIQETFGLLLPQAVIKTLLRSQEAKGHVVVHRNVCMIDRKALGDVDLEAVRQGALRQQEALIETLSEFASKRFGFEWDSIKAQGCLLAYVEQFSARVFQTTMGHEQLPAAEETWAQDQYVVHRFVLHVVKAAPDSFEFLTTLVEGKMLADAMYLNEAEILEGAEPLTDLEVYLDTPILLRLLGLAGEELVAPYRELLELLNRQGAIVRCFVANVEEARRILDFAADQAKAGQADRVSGDVYRHLARQKSSESDIKLLAERIPTELLRLRVQPVEMPASRPRAAVDEDALKRRLRRELPAQRNKPLETDVEALAAIHRLRGGNSARTLPKSRAVFVTRSYGLYKVSSEFFGQTGTDSTIPHCILMSAFTTMVWVREPLAAPKMPKTRVIADARAAMRPNEQLRQAFDQEIEKLRRQDDISAQDAHHLRVTFESEKALMDQTLGDESAYTEGTAKQILQRSAEDERLATERRRAAIEQAGGRYGKRASRLLFAVVIPLICLGAIFGALGILADLESPLPGYLQWPATIAFGLLSIYSFIDGVSFRGRAQATARSLEKHGTAIALKVHRVPARKA